jgi:L-threonylcarbamoyladenylate synthase
MNQSPSESIFGNRPLRVGPDEYGIARAADALRQGELVGLPTETVYGLAADATNGHAVAAIYEAKGRPRFNPLIVHVHDLAAAKMIGALSATAHRLAERFWPGPMTLVVPVKAEAGLSSLVTAGLETVAIRIPGHPIARRIIEAAGRPIAAPSANLSGRVSPTLAEHVVGDLGDRVAVVVDGGPCDIGLESTIVTLTDREMLAILRPGGLSGDTLLEAGFGIDTRPKSDRIIAPGMLESHYAPIATVVLDHDDVTDADAILDFGCALAHITKAKAYFDLSPSRDLREAAANFFSGLRALDARSPARIVVAQLPVAGLGEAIRDRLWRAAASRPHF